MDSEDDGDVMKLLSKIAIETNIPVDTLRFWARTHQLGPDGKGAVKLPTIIGPAWHTTKNAALERNARRGIGGRPRKN